MSARDRKAEYERPSNFGFMRLQTVRSDITSIEVEKILTKICMASGDMEYLYGADLPITNILPMALGRD